MALHHNARPRHLHPAQLQGRGGHDAVLLAAAQEGRESRRAAAREGEDQHWRPRGAHLPAWAGPYLRFLRLSLCWLVQKLSSLVENYGNLNAGKRLTVGTKFNIA
jgi:hypothetical protein